MKTVASLACSWLGLLGALSCSCKSEPFVDLDGGSRDANVPDTDRGTDAVADSHLQPDTDGRQERDAWADSNGSGGANGTGGSMVGGGGRGGAGGVIDNSDGSAGGVIHNTDGGTGGVIDNMDAGDGQVGTGGNSGGPEAGLDTGVDTDAMGFDANDGSDVGSPGETVVDIEGNRYKTVAIGAQVWFKENLKVTKYRDGSAIANVASDAEWKELTSGAFAWYGNEASQKDVYGALYNHYAATDPRGLCPVGWSVPSSAELAALLTYLGGVAAASGKLRETGTAYWKSPNDGADNSSGFSALPGGYRFSGMTSIQFEYIQEAAFFWAAGASASAEADSLALYYDWPAAMIEANPSRCGMSVRCIKR